MGDIRKPEGLIEVGGMAGMSNCGHTIDDGVEEALRRGDSSTTYAGYNFNGQVWFADAMFHCEIWCYQSYEETISAENIEALMENVSDKYGWD